jgi:hypothetical protein
VKYLILIYSNPESRKIWDSFSTDEKTAGLEQYAAFTADLVASGEYLHSESLAGPTTRVHVRDGRTLTTDGPFAEVKEHLAGLYAVDCATPERAVEIAARIPEAGLGLVEVRPVRASLTELL